MSQSEGVQSCLHGDQEAPTFSNITGVSEPLRTPWLTRQVTEEHSQHTGLTLGIIFFFYLARIVWINYTIGLNPLSTSYAQLLLMFSTALPSHTPSWRHQ